MYKIYGYPTQNTIKALYVLEEIGVEYEYEFVDLFKGENRQESFLLLNPFGKVPTLQHDNESIFESGAICRFIANNEKSTLYPNSSLPRAKVDQWMDFFSCHLGKWLSTLYFENVIKSKVGMGDADDEKCAEAIKFAVTQLAIIDAHLATNSYFIGDELSIADLFAFAYIEQAAIYNLSLTQYPHVTSWLEKIENKESIKRVRARLA